MASVTRVRRTGKRATKRKTTRKTRASAATSVQAPASGGFFGKSHQSVVLYGPSGVGKTSLAAHFPRPLFIIDSQEDGILDLMEYGQCPKPVDVVQCNDWSGLHDACELAVETDCDTVVFDSLTGFEKLCFIHHCEEHFDGDWSKKGFYNYQQGPKNAAKTDWPSWLDVINTVRQSGKTVILVAHSTTKQVPNPEGADYDQYLPYLDKETWQQTHRWAKMVLFYNYHVDVDKSGPRNKAKMDDQRFIYTEWSPAALAKNRCGLPAVINAGSDGSEAYEAFVKAFQSVVSPKRTASRKPRRKVQARKS